MLSKCEIDGQVIEWVDERKRKRGKSAKLLFYLYSFDWTFLSNHSSVEIINIISYFKPQSTD